MKADRQDWQQLAEELGLTFHAGVSGMLKSKLGARLLAQQGQDPEQLEKVLDNGLLMGVLDAVFLGVIITLHDKRTNLARDVKKQIETVFGNKVFKTAISKSVRLEESPAYKQSIFKFAPSSSGAIEYYSLSEEVISRV